MARFHNFALIAIHLVGFCGAPDDVEIRGHGAFFLTEEYGAFDRLKLHPSIAEFLRWPSFRRFDRLWNHSQVWKLFAIRVMWTKFCDCSVLIELDQVWVQVLALVTRDGSHGARGADCRVLLRFVTKVARANYDLLTPTSHLSWSSPLGRSFSSGHCFESPDIKLFLELFLQVNYLVCLFYQLCLLWHPHHILTLNSLAGFVWVRGDGPRTDVCLGLQQFILIAVSVFNIFVIVIVLKSFFITMIVIHQEGRILAWMVGRREDAFARVLLWRQLSLLRQLFVLLSQIERQCALPKEIVWREVAYIIQPLWNLLLAEVQTKSLFLGFEIETLFIHVEITFFKCITAQVFVLRIMYINIGPLRF